jgi:hypothetical protein
MKGQHTIYLAFISCLHKTFCKENTRKYTQGVIWYLLFTSFFLNHLTLNYFWLYLWVNSTCLPFRSTWVHPGFHWVRVARSLVLLVVVSPFVFFLLAIMLSVLPRLTATDYPFGILDLRLLITPLVSWIYGFWFPLWYLRFTASDYPFGILDLRLLITPLVS